MKDIGNQLRAAKKKRTLKEYLTGYSFIIPALTILTVFAIFPTIYVFYLSGFKWDMVGPREFVGLQNYLNVLFRPPYAKEFGMLFL